MSDKDSVRDTLPLGEIANPVNTEEGPFATDDSKISVPVREKSIEPLQQEEEKPNDIKEGLVVNDESRVSMTVPAGSMSRQEEDDEKQEEGKTKDIEERFSDGDDYCSPSTANPVESTEPPAQVEVKGSEKPKDTEEGLLVDDESRISITGKSQSAENRESSKQEEDEEKQSEEKPVVIEVGYAVGNTPNANPAGTIQPMPIQELTREEEEEQPKDIEEEVVVSDESKVSVTSPLSSVIKIASKFRGPSKIETQAEFLHRQREFTEKQRLIAKAIAQYQLTSQSVEKSGSLKPPPSSSSPSDTHIHHYPLHDEEGEVDHNPVENDPLERNGMEIVHEICTENSPPVADVSIREESYQDDQIHELPLEDNETKSMLCPGHHPFSDVEPKPVIPEATLLSLLLEPDKEITELQKQTFSVAQEMISSPHDSTNMIDKIDSSVLIGDDDVDVDRRELSDRSRRDYHHNCHLLFSVVPITNHDTISKDRIWITICFALCFHLLTTPLLLLLHPSQFYLPLSYVGIMRIVATPLSAFYQYGIQVILSRFVITPLLFVCKHYLMTEVVVVDRFGRAHHWSRLSLFTIQLLLQQLLFPIVMMVVVFTIRHYLYLTVLGLLLLLGEGGGGLTPLLGVIRELLPVSLVMLWSCSLIQWSYRRVIGADGEFSSWPIPATKNEAETKKKKKSEGLAVDHELFLWTWIFLVIPEMVWKDLSIEVVSSSF